MLKIVLAFLLGSTSAMAECDFNCKIRITACETATGKCSRTDVLPEQTGLCGIMIMGVAGEWVSKHPGQMFKSAECVAPDDVNL